MPVSVGSAAVAPVLKTKPPVSAPKFNPLASQAIPALATLVDVIIIVPFMLPSAAWIWMPALGLEVPMPILPKESMRIRSVPVVANVNVPLEDSCASSITPASFPVFANVLIFKPDESKPKTDCKPFVVPSTCKVALGELVPIPTLPPL